MLNGGWRGQRARLPSPTPTDVFRGHQSFGEKDTFVAVCTLTAESKRRSGQEWRDGQRAAR